MGGKFTTEQLHAAHVFKFVKDETDQLSVCETARTLYEGLPEIGDFDPVEYLLGSYVVKDDEYMADELRAIFYDTIWAGKV